MDKFIKFNGVILNTHYIIEMRKFTRFGDPKYGIIMRITDEEVGQWFDSEEERDRIFIDIFSKQLSNE